MATHPNNTERPPVIVVMGHIDHGKSTLLDYIRKTNLVAGEAGGITQHLSAYEVNRPGKDGAEKRITFLDTPGHEAFMALRSRGANVADIAILVVSAEDGVKAQTLEAYGAIEKSGIPYLVAINKIDKPNANIERTKQTLAEHGIYLEGMGGNISWVPISAKTGAGVDDLLDLVLLAAELLELKATPEAPASGIVIEAHVDQRKGISATLIIKDGSLETGSYVVAGTSFAPVRFIETPSGSALERATFSSPVSIVGFTELPEAGSVFTTVSTKKEAEALASSQKKERAAAPVSSDEEDGRAVLPLIVKADVAGTLDAINHELGKLDQSRVRIKHVASGVGPVSENDARIAAADEHTVILGFNVEADARARELAERDHTPIMLFSIIYKLSEAVAALIEERTLRIATEETEGEAKVIKVFSTTKGRTIFGGKVLSGTITRGEEVIIVRSGEEVGRGTLTSLERNRAEAPKAEEGSEFGAQIETKVSLAAGDLVRCFRVIHK